MIRRSAQRIAGNAACAHQLWKVATSGFWQSSGGNGELEQRLGSSLLGRHSGLEDSHPVQEFGILKAAVPDAHVTSRRPEDFAHLLSRNNRLVEKRWWMENKASSSCVEYQNLHHSTSGWSSKLGKDPHQGSSPLEFWNRGRSVRVMSTKRVSVEGDGNVRSSSEEEKSQPIEEVPARPKSIEDFQHEEIVGPTVERDESDTAHELRASLGQLTTFMTSLRTGFLLLGSVQLLAALWSLHVHGAGLFPGLLQDSAFVMSFLLAYLLRLFGSRVEFFSKIEERSRMRILTLSLQANKMLTTFFFRSSFVVKAVALCSLIALLGDVWLFHSGVVQNTLV